MTGKFSSNIRSCKLKLRNLRRKRDVESIAKYKDAKWRLSLILEQKEIFWRQRSKQLWLHSGDKNSKYFLASPSARRRSNQIHKLKNGEGEWVDWDEGLTEHITEHFSNLFTATQSN